MSRHVPRRVLIVTPVPPSSRQGNRISAVRWGQMLRSLGHQVTIAQAFSGQRSDLLLALHARKSAVSVARYRAAEPEKPIVLALTGTDLYGDIHRVAVARRSLDLADRLLLLQPHGARELPEAHQDKVRVIFQSVDPLRRRPAPSRRFFEVTVVGHLRAVKDPLRTALAARRLPSSSKIRVLHLGGALDPAFALRAEREMQRNPRYRWLGSRPRGEALRWVARSRLLSLTSRLEGGANVISEAVAVGTPVISSHISGSIGLLGENYPGFFPVGNTRALTDLLDRCERDPGFYRLLHEHSQQLTPLIRPAEERRRWKSLLAELD